MPKFNKSEDELYSHFEKWLFVLKNLHKLIDRPAKLQEKIFSQLFEQAEIAQFDDNEYNAYEESLKEYRDLKNSLDTAFDDGIEKVARNMIAEGLAFDLISKMTGLPTDKIDDLKSKMNES